MEVYDDMNLFITNDKFIIEPNGKGEELVINRVTEEVIVQKKTNTFPITPATRRICGILGTIKLINGVHLIVATHRIFVGLINGQVIWRLAGHDIIPYIPSLLHLTETQKKQHETYLSMLKTVLETPHFYFSYTYDLSHTLQRLHSMPPEFLQMGLYERAESRFVWNGQLLSNIQSKQLTKYCLPLIHGFVSINQVTINQNTFSWILVSRRSIQRAGTRLFSRGIDDKGYCSNFVETEQIVEYAGDKTSFVQTRGSIPLFWAQMPNIKYKPRPQLDYTKDHLAAATKHFDAQLLYYGRQVLINLIDHRGAEQVLEQGYSNVILELRNSAVRYESFDFHAECRKMRWDRLNILIDRLAHEQDEFSLFHLRFDGALISLQDGVFRTNCVDCLDRTNVVQSMLAKRSLKFILTKLGILTAGQRIDDTIGFSSLYKNVWADNADMVSTQYSGTGALKTDFTRTGKRTIIGAFWDGVNSAIRYYKNNFNDGYRQDAIDLFLGNYKVQDGEGIMIKCPLDIKRGWKRETFPSALLFAVAMFFASATFPHEYNTINMLFLLFWGAMIGLTARSIFKNGTEFVDWPKLMPPNKSDDA